MPAWNEEVGIIKTLESVIKANYPNLEVIVIYDGSTDDTDRIVREFIKNFETTGHRGVEIIYCPVENGGKAKALNHALGRANGEIIITIDADSVMDPDAIWYFVRHFVDPTIASVAGNVIVGNNGKPIGLIQQLEYLYGFYFKRADSIFNAVYIVGGAAAAYRRSIIMEVGGFDESMITEDIELSTRLQDCGYRVRYEARAVIYTEGPSSIAGLCTQRLRWKYGRLLTFYKYRHLFFSFKPHHNQYLTFLILPVTLFAEALLFFEGILLVAFYTYTFYTNDFVPLAVVIIALAVIVSFQVLTDPKTRFHTKLLLLAPVAWLVFYFMDMIEYQALIRSLTALIRKRKLSWQKWNRIGVFNAKPPME